MIIKLKKIFRVTPVMFFLFLTLGFAFYACDDEYNLEKIDPDMTYDLTGGFPIGNINIDLKNFLEDIDSTVLKEDADGMFYILFEKDVLSYKGEDKIFIPGQAPINIPNLDLPGIFIESSISIDSSINFPITLENDMRLDSLFIKRLAFHVGGTSGINYVADLELVFPTIKKGTTLFTFKVPVGEVPDGQSKAIDYTSEGQLASDYAMSFIDNAGKLELPVKIKLTIYGEKGQVFKPNQSLSLALSIPELSYKFAFGYVGQYGLLDVRDSFNIDILNREIAKNIEWKNPKASIILNNSFGIPIRFNIENITILPFGTNTPENVTPVNASNPKDMGYSSTISNLYKKDSVILDKENSPALFRGLEKAPQTLSYHLTGRCNPDGALQTNIVADTSMIKGKFIFELPLYFRSSGLTHTDTMELDLFGDNDKTSVKSMLFRIVSENEMPFDMLLQLDFLDENNNHIAYLFENANDSERRIIKGAEVDQNGNTIKSTKYTQNIIFNEKALEGLSKATKVVYSVQMMTTNYNPANGPYVKFKDGIKLKMSFITQFQAKIDL